jgi:hypothetical protein
MRTAYRGAQGEQGVRAHEHCPLSVGKSGSQINDRPSAVVDGERGAGMQPLNSDLRLEQLPSTTRLCASLPDCRRALYLDQLTFVAERLNAEQSRGRAQRNTEL